MRSSVLLAFIAILVGGCFTTTTVAPADVRRISKSAGAPVQMATSTFDGARLGPRTAIRARRADGTTSPWFTAGSLSTSRQGLLTGRSLSLNQLAAAVVRDLEPEAETLITFLAPPGGTVRMLADGFVLQAATGPDLARWAAAVATGSLSAGGPAGTWTFRAPGTGWLAERVAGERLASVPLPAIGRLRVVEGIPWSDVAGLDLHNFDPVTSVAAVAGVGLILAMAVASARSNVDPSPVIDLGAHAGIAAAESATGNDGPVAEPDDGRLVGFLVDPEGADGAISATPLFTGSARRRDIAKLLLTADSAWDGDNGLTGAAGVGFRLFDFWELSARVRGLHLGGPGAAEGASRLHVLAGGRLSLHIDGDAQPATALVLGIEIMGGALDAEHTLTTTTLSIGPRVGIGHVAFLSFLFSPTYIAIEDSAGSSAVNAAIPTPPSEWRLLFGVELGLAL